MGAEEITKVIYEDLQDALSVIAENIENPSAAIESINVRVGERSNLIQSTEDLDPSPFSSENGWIIDVKFSQFELKEKGLSTFKTQSAFPLFSRLPVSRIKGIGPKWTDRFKQEGINTIGVLRRTDGELLEKISRQYNSINPFAYRNTAAQLDRNIPITMIESFGEIYLYRLIKEGPGTILKECPDEAMKQNISDFFDCCANSIDAHVLKSIRLNMLGTA